MQGSVYRRQGRRRPLEPPRRPVVYQSYASASAADHFHTRPVSISLTNQHARTVKRPRLHAKKGNAFMSACVRAHLCVRFKAAILDS